MSALKVGFAQTSILPPEGVPVSLCGQFEVRITTEVHDPLLSVAMVLEKDGVRSIWVAYDLNFVPTELTREVEAILKDRLPDFSPEQLIITATHTHTAPHFYKKGLISLTGELGLMEAEGALTSEEYRRYIVPKIADSVVAAWENLEECELEFSVAQIITGVNRRVVYQDGSAQMYGNIYRKDFDRMEGRDGGPSQFLYAYRKSDRKLLGIAAAIPCPSQCYEAANYMSADYWEVVRREIAGHYGPDVTILGMCRSAGNLSPHAMVDRIRNYNDKRNCIEEAEQMGRWIAENIISHQNRSFLRLDSDTVLRQAGLEQHYDLWPVTEEEYQAAKAYEKEVPVFDPSNPKFDLFTFANTWVRVQRVEKQPKSIPILLRATRVGDLALISLPGEIYIEYADRIRLACPEAIVIDIQLACSQIGYLATEAAVKGGHYSANIFNGLLTPAEGDKLVADVIDLIHSLYQ